MPYITGSGGAASSAGKEINYTQITAGVSIVSTTEATPTTLISPGAITFDGQPVLLTVYIPAVVLSTAASSTFTVTLFESSTQIGRLGSFEEAAAATQTIFPSAMLFRFTPTAASHTYTIGAFVNVTTGTPQIICGAGGTGTNVPAFARFTKV